MKILSYLSPLCAAFTSGMAFMAIVAMIIEGRNVAIPLYFITVVFALAAIIAQSVRP